MALTIYLAGPEVFLPNAEAVLAAKAELVRALGHHPLTPMDLEPEDAGSAFGVGVSIYRNNKMLMDKSDVIIANLTPFRGVGADPGTAFELGYMIARGARALIYTNIDTLHRERCIAYYDQELAQADDGRLCGMDGLAIEEFEMFDNLMLHASVQEAGGTVVVGSVTDPARLYDDLEAFRRCLAAL